MFLKIENKKANIKIMLKNIEKYKIIFYLFIFLFILKSDMLSRGIFKISSYFVLFRYYKE